MKMNIFEGGVMSSSSSQQRLSTRPYPAKNVLLCPIYLSQLKESRVRSIRILVGHLRRASQNSKVLLDRDYWNGVSCVTTAKSLALCFVNSQT